MAELSVKHRRRGLEFAKALSALASRAPDDTAKSTVYAASKRLQRHYGFSDEEKRREVTKAIRLGCSTYDDIATETKFPKPDIRQIVNAMASENLVEIRTLQSTDRGGRPAAFISLTGSEPE